MEVKDLELNRTFGGCLGVLAATTLATSIVGAGIIYDGVKKKKKGRKDEPPEMEIFIGSIVTAAGIVLTGGMVAARLSNVI